MKPEDQAIIDSFKKIFDNLKPDKKQKILELAGLVEKKSKARRDKDEMHGETCLPSKIITNCKCLHCGYVEVLTRHPRKRAFLVEAGGYKRDKEKFKMSEEDVVIVKNVETRCCERCREFVKTFTRQELEAKYLVLLKQ